jgi:hypothetical protein
MLALLAAGTASRPEQIEAFEHYYNANTPLIGGPFVAVDEISISGLAITSTPLRVRFHRMEAFELAAGLNAFGGVYVWRAGPDGKIVTEPNDFRWEMKCEYTHIDGGEYVIDDEWVRQNLDGHIRYINQNGIRCTRPIVSALGRLI